MVRLFVYICSLLIFLGFNNILFAKDPVLNIYSWAGLIPDPIIRQFEQTTKIGVNLSTYVNNEILYAKLKTNPTTNYDLILPSNYMVERMAKNHMLLPIDKALLLNIKHLDPLFLQPTFGDSNTYGIPYVWSATGVLVNTKYHPSLNIQHWQDLGNPIFNNQLLLLDDTRELFSLAFLALKQPINNTDPIQINRAFTFLKTLLPNVKLFNTEALRSIYIDEDITIGMSWNSDAYLAKKENPALTFFYPADGFVVSFDCFAIPIGAKNIANALRFIDFILQPEIAKEIALHTGFSTTNLSGKQLLPENIKHDPTAYPSTVVMRRASFQTDVGAAILTYEKYFEELKL